MFVHSFRPEPATRAETGAALPPNYTPPQWVNGRALRTASGVLIGGALVRNMGPAANDEMLTLVSHDMTEDGERLQAALLNPRTAPRRLRDRVLRVLHILRTEVRARRLLRAALHETTVKRLVSWL